MNQPTDQQKLQALILQSRPPVHWSMAEIHDATASLNKIFERLQKLEEHNAALPEEWKLS
jgi:hypothetical protein